MNGHFRQRNKQFAYKYVIKSVINKPKISIKIMALEFTDSNIKEVIESGKPVVVDFWAEWCGPCRLVGPFIEELAEEYAGKVEIGKLNVDDNVDTPNEYGIRNIPTILFFKDGKLADKVVGAAQKAALKAKIEAIL